MESLKSLFEMPFSARQRRLAASRPPLSKDDFIAKIASDDRGRGAAALLWDKLNAAKVREELSPYPDDDLLRVYGLADEDLDEDIILAIIRDVGVPVPDREMVAIGVVTLNPLTLLLRSLIFWGVSPFQSRSAGWTTDIGYYILED